MHQLAGYHRPTSVAEAVRLLTAPHRMALAGGTTIRHNGGAEPMELVDLQALGLDGIEPTSGRLRLGATTTLQAVADGEAVPDLIRQTARAEQPSATRTLATVGGTIGAAENDRLLLAALLVHDASVELADGREETLEAVLHDGVRGGNLIVGVTVAPGGATAMAATGRTPADRPIVAALARNHAEGIRLALCGVAPTPELVDPTRFDRLEPPGDFRGSPNYRRHLAQVLTSRVLEELS
jgi:CO/xanthine dehydrogenase FAD-binding subunit